jgi:hypothetical protein
MSPFVELVLETILKALLAALTALFRRFREGLP